MLDDRLPDDVAVELHGNVLRAVSDRPGVKRGLDAVTASAFGRRLVCIVQVANAGTKQLASGGRRRLGSGRRRRNGA